MKNLILLALAALALGSGCNRQTQEDDVVAERYVHKYGYAIAKEEWEAKNYPGQVITHMRDGTVSYRHL